MNTAKSLGMKKNEEKNRAAVALAKMYVYFKYEHSFQKETEVLSDTRANLSRYITAYGNGRTLLQYA